MTGRLVVNLTASATWRRRPVGIIRVERELSKQLWRLSEHRMVPVVLHHESGDFRRLDDADVDKIMADDWVTAADPDDDGGLNIRERAIFKPDGRDRFISVGSDWSFDVPSRVAQLYGDKRCLVPACYDLIPILFPEYTPDSNFFNQFTSHYRQIAKLARWVFAISENSKNDLLNFWRTAGIDSNLPNVDVVPLAGLRSPAEPPALSAVERQTLDSVLDSGEYVLFVSTIEPRKNHQLLLNAWRELFLERGSSCPQLIFVGMRGWGSSDLLAQMQKMSATKAGRIKWLEGVSDRLLHHFYQHALFSAFPSVYEGWGLAATEALTHGKVCIVSSSSALQEAAQDLVPAVDPADFLAWRAQIRRMIDDHLYRRELEKVISMKFKPRTWDDFGKDFFEILVRDDENSSVY